MVTQGVMGIGVFPDGLRGLIISPFPLGMVLVTEVSLFPVRTQGAVS